MLYYKTWSKFNHACQRKAEHLLTMRVGGYGALAQLVARDIRIVEARGSTPLCSTSCPAGPGTFPAGMAELADAHDSGSCVRTNLQVQVLFPAPRNP